MPPTIEKQNKSCLPIDDGSQHSFGLFHRTIEQPNNIFLCSLFLQATAIDLHSSLSVWISFLALVMQEIHRDGKSNIRRTRLPSAADGKDLTPRLLFYRSLFVRFPFFNFSNEILASTSPWIFSMPSNGERLSVVYRPPLWSSSITSD